MICTVDEAEVLLLHLNNIEASAAAAKAEPQQQQPVVFVSTSRQPAVVEQQLGPNVPVVANVPADRPQRRRKAKSKDYDDLGGVTSQKLSSEEQEQRQVCFHIIRYLETMHD